MSLMRKDSWPTPLDSLPSGSASEPDPSAVFEQSVALLSEERRILRLCLSPGRPDTSLWEEVKQDLGNDTGAGHNDSLRRVPSLMPLLANKVLRGGLPASAPLASRLRTALLVERVRHRANLALAAEVLGAATRPPLMIGGLAVAEQAYDTPELRHTAGLVLFAGDNEEAEAMAGALARDPSWTIIPQPGKSPTRNLGHRSGAKVRIFGGRMSGAANYCGYDSLVRRAVCACIDGHGYRQPSVSDAIALTVAHIANKPVNSLVWVCDIVCLMRKLDRNGGQPVFDGLPASLRSQIASAMALGERIATADHRAARRAQ
jgi:hypothetical protein